jgi:uncharacterized protein YmfQ (DUF2313 family)
MRATINQYLRNLQTLLPQGRAWPTEAGAVLTKLLGGVAAGLARVHNRALDLVEEADPRTTVELITDWERICDLPDDCAPAGGGTLAERRDAVVARITARGGQSRAFFIELAARLGYEITIDEFHPFTCDSSCDDPVNDEEWWFAWRVNAPEETVREFTCDSPCDEPLATWGNELLECNLSRLKPAHTTPIFAYGG